MMMMMMMMMMTIVTSNDSNESGVSVAEIFSYARLVGIQRVGYLAKNTLVTPLQWICGTWLFYPWKGRCLAEGVNIFKTVDLFLALTLFYTEVVGKFSDVNSSLQGSSQPSGIVWKSTKNLSAPVLQSSAKKNGKNISPTATKNISTSLQKIHQTTVATSQVS